MKLQIAHKILKNAGITWNNYFDLIKVGSTDVLIINAVERIKTYLIHGK